MSASPSDSRCYKVLLVDDSPDDRLFLRLVLEKRHGFQVIAESHDGQEAIDYLRGEGPFGDRPSHPFPDLMLLDLKMPVKTGFDVLQWLRTANLGNLTVAVMSGSWLAEDIAKSLALGAHTYFKKTSLKEEQEKMIHTIEKLLHDRG